MTVTSLREGAGTRWRPGRLACIEGLALAWLGSWFFAPTRALWDVLDLALFRVLDATLAWGPPWTVLWAALNSRAFDLCGAAFFAVLVLVWALRAGRRGLGERLALGAFVGAYTSAVIALSSHVIFDFERLSPTWVVDGARRLSELVPWIEHKDWSGKSFPGDHGTAVIMFTTLIGWTAGWRYGAVAAVGAVLLSLPRLMSGAHWASDLLAGSVAVAGVALGVVAGTPILALVARMFAAPIEWVIERIERVVGVRGSREGA